MILKIINSLKYRLKKLLESFKKTNGAGEGKVGLPEAYHQKQKFQNDFLKSHGLLPHNKFVDIGCGVLRGGLPLIAYLDTGNYVGIDIRKQSLSIG